MSNSTLAQPRRWNFFARELADILATHGASLSQLYHRTTINPAIVSRLRQSLTQRYPKYFPVLNSEQIDEIITNFQLTEEEQMRLRAAILATGIERILMDRLDPENALLATEQIYPTLLNALRGALREIEGLGSLRTGAGMEDQHNGEDTTFDLVFEAFDRSSLALHLSGESASPQDRILKARQARDGFLIALHELESLPDSVKGTEEWQVWLQEVQHGLTESQRRVELLEE
jgi:hypothetical protein